MRRRGRKKNGKDCSHLLTLANIFRKKIREYFNAIRAHYIRRSSYSPSKYRMSSAIPYTPYELGQIKYNP